MVMKGHIYVTVVNEMPYFIGTIYGHVKTYEFASRFKDYGRNEKSSRFRSVIIR